MPAITPTDQQFSGTMTEVTLNGTDTFDYQAGQKQILILRNPTAGAIVPTIVGAGASASAPTDTYGAINLSAGLAIASIAAGAIRAITLDSLPAYLVGACSITGGTGLVASIIKGH